MSTIKKTTVRRKSEPARAWGIYYRVSSEDLQHPEFSVPAQRMEIMRALVEPSGMVVHREYTDIASGTSEAGRAEYLQMFADAEAGLFSHLAIHKWDRFGRHLLEALQAEERLATLGVSICAANLQVDSTTYTGWMSKTLQQVLAQGYAMNLREESKKGKLVKLQGGGWCCQAPIGYRNVQRSDGRKFDAWVEVDPERAGIVRRIFSMYASDKMNLAEIACQLNREGVPSPRGREWLRPTVKLILQNPFYIGKLVSPRFGVQAQGNWEPIVEPGLWDEAQERLAQRKRFRTAGRVFPLSGLLRLEGSPLNAAYFEVRNAAGERVAYVYYELRREGEKRAFFRAERIEEQVGGWLERVRVDPGRADALREEYERHVHGGGEAKRRAEIERKLATADTEGDALIRMCAKGLISEAEFSTKRQEIAAEVADLRKRLAGLPHGRNMMQRFDEVAGTLACLPDTWAQATPEDRRTIARTVFRSVEINREGEIVGVEYHPPFEQIAFLLASR